MGNGERMYYKTKHLSALVDGKGILRDRTKLWMLVICCALYRIIESPRLKKTSKIIQSNFHLSPIFCTKPWPSVQHLHVSWTRRNTNTVKRVSPYKRIHWILFKWIEGKHLSFEQLVMPDEPNKPQSFIVLFVFYWCLCKADVFFRHISFQVLLYWVFIFFLMPCQYLWMNVPLCI